MQTIYIRRSVASGEAVFPLSDLDLAMVIEPASGAQIESLRRRYQLARVAFPRLGECQLFTQADLDEFSVTDPYRASLDRRFAVTVYGPPPIIPAAPLPPMETARRLVFWFEHFIPTAVRHRNRRNLRKFALEIINALGVLEGHWPEPLRSRREAARRAKALQIDVRDDDLHALCFECVARAHARLRPPAPSLSSPIEVDGFTVVPSIDVVREAGRASATWMTAEVLDLLLHTQSPWLWRRHGDALHTAGFEPPHARTWTAAARRYAGDERVRGPGFLESGTRSVVARLVAAADILGGERPKLPPTGTTASVFYAEYYDALTSWAAQLRARAVEKDR